MRLYISSYSSDCTCFKCQYDITLAETDEHEAMRQFIILKNFANKEYHVLTLQKNEAAVNSNVHLSNYRGFFTHLHFTARKILLRLLHWNLDEFHQANIGFRL